MTYILHLVILFALYSIVAMSLNFVFGYCGYLSLAHAGYFAIGAYTYALATVAFGLGALPAVAIGICIAVVASFALSFPAWRFRGDFFVLISLAVQALLFSLFFNLYETGSALGRGGNLTNGPFGIASIPRPELLGVAFATTGSVVLLASIAALVCAGVTWRLLSSPWGRVLRAVRDDELAARSLGKRVRLAKVQAFAISCSMAAVAGAVYAIYVSYVDPSSASLDQAILFLAMLLVGGAGNFRGPVVGAAVLLLIPEALRFAQVPDAQSGNLRLFAYGVLLVLMMHLRPQGLAGEYRFQ